MAKIPFMDVPGSDPSAVMKGDHAQTVRGTTAPGSKVKKPKKVGSSQYALPKDKRRK